MKIDARIRNIVLGCCVIGAALLIDVPLPGGIAVDEAEAIVGRPMTPGSVAGVARRTTRRTVRRTTRYVATLPRGCTKVTIEGVVLSHCGGTYYQPHNNQYVVVIVD